jgi:maleate isomerase
MSRPDIRRLGVLIGDSDPVVEYDFQRFLPSNVSFHIGRLDMPPAPKLAANASLQMMCDSAPSTAHKVAMAEVEHFLFACTSASFFRGEGWDRAVAKSITDATGVPAITTATAAADALESLGAERVFLLTPYSANVNAAEVAFLGYRGIEVVGQFSFGCTYSREVSHFPPDRIAETTISLRNEIRKADALFISCTMLRAMEIAEQLEAALGLPVVTSNSGSLWSLLRSIGEPTDAVRAGRIFREADREHTAPGSPTTVNNG